MAAPLLSCVWKRCSMFTTRPSAHLSATVELRFQFRYAAPPEPRLLQLDPQTLCFSAAGRAPSKAAGARKKVEQEHVTKALAGLGQQVSLLTTFGPLCSSDLAHLRSHSADWF